MINILTFSILFVVHPISFISVSIGVEVRNVLSLLDRLGALVRVLGQPVKVVLRVEHPEVDHSPLAVLLLVVLVHFLA